MGMPPATSPMIPLGDPHAGVAVEDFSRTEAEAFCARPGQREEGIGARLFHFPELSVNP